jgi:hypothetical protein
MGVLITPKTHLIEFGRFAANNRKQKKQGKPAHFVFLGFTHVCSIKRSNGGFMLKRYTNVIKGVRYCLDDQAQI